MNSMKVLFDFQYKPSQLNPKDGVPLKSHFVHNNAFKISNLRIDDLINLIEKFLSINTKISWNKKSHFVYEGEYNPIEGMRINPKDKVHGEKLYSAILCAYNASEKFLYNANDDDDEFLPGPYCNKISFNNWFTFEIRILYDSEFDNYILEIHRTRGETMAFYTYLSNPLKQYLNDNVLWTLRRHYINLLEGIQIVPYKETSISSYLLDDYVCRDICSYLVSEVDNYKKFI